MKFAADSAEQFLSRSALLQTGIAVLADIHRQYQTVEAKAGQIDLLLVNRQVLEPNPFGKISESHFDIMFDTDVKGLVLAVSQAIPLLANGSSAISNGAIAASVGVSGLCVYAGSQSAVEAFARSWMLDLKRKGIRINVLSPGHIDTSGTNALPDYDLSVRLTDSNPPVPMGKANEIGNMGACEARANPMNGDALFNEARPSIGPHHHVFVGFAGLAPKDAR